MSRIKLSPPSYAHDVLVDTEWPAAPLHDDDVRVLEASEDPGLYDPAHAFPVLSGWTAAQTCGFR
ncbi:hypothetical protein [Deinococcus navajonensis]|uniref:Uncharacterized protein n=1 Tax=Deinococcus navajonensis TaxID=309884 RepID=A0ABV8XLK9_9DEIO